MSPRRAGELFIGSYIDLPLSLDHQWRAYAEHRGVTLVSVVRDALREYLEAESEPDGAGFPAELAS